MKQKNTPTDDAATLAREVLAEAATLVDQHVQLVRSEIRQNLDQCRQAAVGYGAGAGLVALSGALATVAAVHGLQRATRLPLWSCYGLLAGAAGLVGSELIKNAHARATAHRPLDLPQTRATLQEDAAWLRDAVQP